MFSIGSGAALRFVIDACTRQPYTPSSILSTCVTIAARLPPGRW